MIVIDASLAVKWYLNEDNSAAAIELLSTNSPGISVPDLFAVEVVSALVREANIDKGWRAEARAMLAQFQLLCQNGGVRLHQTSSAALNAAASLAIDIGHPLKDCIYLVLAMELDCELVTCDARFAKRAKDVWDRVRVLEAQT